MSGCPRAKNKKGIAEKGFCSGAATVTCGILSLISFSTLCLGQEVATPAAVEGRNVLGAAVAPTLPGSIGAAPNSLPLVLAPVPVNALGTAFGENPNSIGAGLTGIGFRLVPSLTVGETYNDNVRLDPRGLERSDLITTISPSFDMLENARRVQGRLVYSPQALIFARGTSADTVQQRLLGTGNAQLYRDMLFLDTSASMEQAFVSATGPIGPTTVTSNGNLQTVRTVNVSPYLREHLSRYADSETRYSFSSIDTSGGQVAPERMNQGRQTFRSGDYFGPLKATLTGEWTRIDRLTSTSDRLSGTSSTDKIARADFQYPIYRALSAIGGVGYEQIRDSTLIVQPNGVIWDVGLNYQPNHLFSTSLTYGRRFEETDIEFSALYALRPDLRVHAAYTQSVQTGQSQIATNLGQVTLGPNGTFINSQTGLPINPNNPNVGVTNSAFGITSGAFLDKRYELDVEANRGRSSYFLSVYDDKHTGQNSVFFGTSSNQRVLGTSISWGRQLWPNLTSTVTGNYSHSTFLDGSGRADDLYSATLGLAYTLSTTASAVLSATRYERNSNFPGNGMIDDVITVSLNKLF